MSITKLERVTKRIGIAGIVCLVGSRVLALSGLWPAYSLVGKGETIGNGLTQSHADKVLNRASLITNIAIAIGIVGVVLIVLFFILFIYRLGLRKRSGLKRSSP